LPGQHQQQHREVECVVGNRIKIRIRMLLHQ
jgi:hypothetical protein